MEQGEIRFKNKIAEHMLESPYSERAIAEHCGFTSVGEFLDYKNGSISPIDAKTIDGTTLRDIKDPILSLLALFDVRFSDLYPIFKGESKERYEPHINRDDYEGNIGFYRVLKGMTVEELVEKSGCSAGELMALQNGTKSPLYTQNTKNGKEGELKPQVKMLAMTLGATPCELFPRYGCEIESDALDKETVPYSQIPPATSENDFIGTTGENIETMMLDKERTAILKPHPDNPLYADNAIRRLRVVEARFYDDATFTGAAIREEITHHRARQLQDKTLSKLKRRLLTSHKHLLEAVLYDQESIYSGVLRFVR